MDNQMEEAEALELESWTEDYDIAEEDEERLLEEDEISEHKHQAPFESEPNFSDTDFETQETEEDVLELGINEDMVECEDPIIEGQEVPDKKSGPSAQLQDLDSVKQTSASPAQVHISPKPEAKKNVNKTGFGPQGASRNYSYNHHPRFSIPVQMRTGSSLRMGQPRFQIPRQHFDHRPRAFAGRPILDYGPPGGLLRPPAPYHLQHPGPHLGEHFSIHDHMQGPMMQRNLRGSVTVHGSGPRQASPSSEMGQGFPPLGKPPGYHNRPPPPVLNPSPPRVRGIVPMRLPPPNPPNMPPPRFNGLHTNSLRPSPRLPPPTATGAPQSLMDVVLRPPFHGGRVPFHCEPAAQQHMPRFNPVEPPPAIFNSTQPPRFALPPGGCKRPAGSELKLTSPLKQLRLDPSGNIHISRTFPSATTAPAASVVPGNISGVSRPVSSGSLPTSAAPSKMSQAQQSSPAAGIRTTVSSVTPPTSACPVPSTTSIFGSPPTPVSSAGADSSASEPVGEDVSPEMREYLQKMEEQRKKREEVLRMKEERRRLKMASTGQDELFKSETLLTRTVNMAATATATVGSSSMGEPSPTFTGNQTGKSPSTSVAVSPREVVSKYSNVNLPSNTGENTISPTQRKTLLVKPTPTPPKTVDADVESKTITPTQPVSTQQRRFKIIVVKNKQGKILEKRRVPIDELPVNISNSAGTWSAATPGSHTVTQSVGVGESATTRVSESVTIEHLSPGATEDAIRDMCQMFGPVQEVYPKLHERKAIVRFTSASGANNFVRNHNMQFPGISVHYL